MENGLKLGTSRWVLSAALMATPAVLFAQAPAAINQAAPTREEIEPPVAEPPRAPRVTIEGDIERAPCALADPAYKDLKVTISEAQFANLKQVSPEELRPAYARYLGTEQPIAAICEIRDAAATILRRKGYLAAVQVPTQRIENGVVKFEVLFARISTVRVRGDAGRAEGLLQAYLGRLSEAEVFNRYEAERYLLLARDLPGYDVRLSLTPAGTPGDLIGEVIVTRTPLDVDFNLQNLGAKDTGRFGGQARAQFYGLTGLGDRTTVSFYSTLDYKEQNILQLGHDFRVGGEGLTLSGRFTYAWTRPDLNTPSAKLSAHTLFATGEAVYPFVRSQGANLRGAAGFDYVNQNVHFNGGPLSKDRLRVGYLRLDGDAVDVTSGRVPAWRVAGSLELRQGFDIFNASPKPGTITGAGGPSRADGRSDATVVRFAGQLDYVVAPGITFSLAPRAQYAFRPLLSFEEYSAGNYTIGRGYDPGTLIGDSGVGATAEVRLDRLVPFTRLDLALQPFAFVDGAWVWNRNTPGDPQRLTSVGAGVRASYANRFRLDVTVAVPTKAAGLLTKRPDPRFLVSLTTKLWPPR